MKECKTISYEHQAVTCVKGTARSAASPSKDVDRSRTVPVIPACEGITLEYAAIP